MSWGMAAAGAATAIGGIVSSKNNSKSAKEPGYLIDAEKSALEKGKAISERPYVAYDKERVADLSANERSAMDLAAKGSEKSGRLFDEAGNMIHDAADMDYQRDVKGYMNPFVDAALDPAIRRQNESYDLQRTKLLNSKAGSLGGDRVALETSALDKNLKESIGDLTAKTYSEAFDKAQAAFFSDSDRKLKAASAMQSVGGDISKLNTGDIQNLMATGGTERLLRQAKLDVNYDAFKEARDWDITNLDPLLKSISASKGGNVTQTQGNNGQIGQVIGAGLAAGAMYFAGRDDGTGPNKDGWKYEGKLPSEVN